MGMRPSYIESDLNAAPVPRPQKLRKRGSAGIGASGLRIGLTRRRDFSQALAPMKTTAASILIILGCVVIMLNTHAAPSPSPKPHTLNGTIGQSVLGQSSGGSYNPTPSPHGYVGRNDGKVQQSTTAGKQTT